MKVLPIGEARQRLPELVRKVAAGHPPIEIGRRGRVEAVLVPPAMAAARQVERRPLRGSVELVGSERDLERDSAALGRLVAAFVRDSATELEAKPRRRQVRRAGTRRRKK